MWSYRLEQRPLAIVSQTNYKKSYAEGGAWFHPVVLQWVTSLMNAEMPKKHWDYD